ncbi:MAG: hypothetical protein WCN98_14325 [Verrucomicrobiaceae bacterium]
MPEDATQKSHAGRWIIGVVLAVVLYVGSAHPVKQLIFRRGYHGTPESMQTFVFTFYEPADWLWERPIFKDLNDKWFSLWMDILGGPSS